MKNLFILSLFLLFSCAHHQKSRLPSSVSFDSPDTVRANSSFFINDLKENEFKEFLQTAQRRNIKKMVFSPLHGQVQTVSTLEDKYFSGDFYLMIGTNFDQTDEVIRKNDYTALYEVVKRLSWLKFRVTINLVASVEDLEATLQSTRPTIITWVSHGNQHGFYDFNSVRVPYKIFQKASPSIYQLILTSCHGSQAMQNHYDKFRPVTLKYWAWDSFVYHDTDVKSFLAGDSWSPYINYPQKILSNGMSCIEKDGKFVLRDEKNETDIQTFSKEESCFYLAANSNQHFACYTKDNKIAIWNRFKKAVVPGIDFDKNYDCISRVSNTHKEKVCRRLDSDNLFHYIPAHSNEPSRETFNSVNECYDHVNITLDI